MDCARLLAMVACRARDEGRTDSLLPGLRYYRFSHPIRYSKTQTLMPGVVVVLQGRKTATLGAQALSYDAARYLVLSGETVCDGTVVEADPDKPYLAIHLDLPPELLVKTLIALAPAQRHAQGTGNQAPAAQNFVAPIDPKVLEALTRLLSASDGAAERQLIAPLVIEEIVIRLLQSDAAAAIRDAAQVTRSAVRIQSAMQFMRENFSQALSVDRIASHVAMSPSHFAHSFREISGTSPMRYLRDIRLDAARTLLLTGGVRAAEAAAKTGFESAAHFTREFKSRFDASPAEYVRRMLLRRAPEFRRIDQ